LPNQTKKLAVKYFRFAKRHTFLQSWNAAKYKITEKLPFRSTYLIYEPINLTIRLTSKCNQRCSFCPRISPITESHYLVFNDMTLDNFKSIIDRFRRAININLTGGEPFLNKEIFEMIEYAHTKRMRVTVATNGVLTYGKADQIINSSLSEIFFSLHADNPVDYERMHGVSKKEFYKISETIEDLVKKKKVHSNNLKLSINSVCTKSNYRKIPDMVSFAEALGVNRLIFLNLIPFSIPGFTKEQSLYESDQDVIDLIESIELKNSELKVMMPVLYKHTITDRSCKMPFRDLTINGDGLVSICCELTEDEKYGNVLKNEDVWNNIYFRKAREMLLDGSKQLFDVCNFCPLMGRPYKELNARDLECI
jgi:MoaA/NifB/PqqE/SkfB family radical SAM enzyme